MKKNSIYNVYSVIKTGMFILILSVFTSMMYAEVMDNSVDVFYIQHNHPRLKNGENDMGRLIIQNKSSNKAELEKVGRNSHGFPTFYR